MNIVIATNIVDGITHKVDDRGYFYADTICGLRIAFERGGCVLPTVKRLERPVDCMTCLTRR